MEEDKKEEEREKAAAVGADGEKSLEAINQELEEATRRAEENLAGWQRAKADFVNFKKDQDKMFVDLRAYANRAILEDLLPTVDSFELATKHLPAELKDSDWAKGVLCIKGMFDKFLADAGVTPIAALGSTFDPHRHEAVAEEESDQPEGTVIEEVQKGYMMGERVLRPAKVKVAK